MKIFLIVDALFVVLNIFSSIIAYINGSIILSILNLAIAAVLLAIVFLTLNNDD